MRKDATDAENLRLAASQLTLAGDTVVASVTEPAQGATDLNGDGDSLDQVIHIVLPIIFADSFESPPP